MPYITPHMNIVNAVKIGDTFKITCPTCSRIIILSQLVFDNLPWTFDNMAACTCSYCNGFLSIEKSNKERQRWIGRL